MDMSLINLFNSRALSNLLVILMVLLHLAPLLTCGEPLNSKWMLIAKSDFIVRARLRIPEAALERQSHGNWIWIEADVEEVCKGELPQGKLLIHYFTEPPEGLPSLGYLSAYNDQDVIVFLTQVDKADATGSDFYFAERTQDVLTPFDSQTFSGIESEVWNQHETVKRFLDKESGEASTADKIRRLFDALTDKNGQLQAWEQLLVLPREEIPFIVKNMNDLRAIPQFDAYLPNPPGSGEARAHYAPQKVVQAALLLLPYLTGIEFRRYESRTPREWLAEMNAWRCWCEHSFGWMNSREPAPSWPRSTPMKNDGLRGTGSSDRSPRHSSVTAFHQSQNHL